MLVNGKLNRFRKVGYILENKSDLIIRNIAINIKKKRLEQNISVHQLSELANIDYAYIYKIEKGERRIGLDALLRITDALNIEIADVFKLSDYERFELENEEEYKKLCISRFTYFIDKCSHEEVKKIMFMLDA